MGVLSHFPLQPFINAYHARTLIETGAGTGTGINHARTIKAFESILSCEIDKEQAAKLNATIGAEDARVKVMAMDSESFLELVLPRVHHNAIFFLDAHFPGADLGKASFDAVSDLDVRLPLERELDVIWDLRAAFKDVILIDDLRIYEEIPNGGLKQEGLGHLMKPGTAFLDKWRDTHVVSKLYVHQGYVTLIPKP